MNKEAAQKYIKELQGNGPVHLPWSPVTSHQKPTISFSREEAETIIQAEVQMRVIAMQKALQSQLSAALVGQAQMRTENADLRTRIGKLEQLILEKNEFYDFNEEDEGVV